MRKDLEVFRVKRRRDRVGATGQSHLGMKLSKV